jgi:hypothetical protein
MRILQVSVTNKGVAAVGVAVIVMMNTVLLLRKK